MSKPKLPQLSFLAELIDYNTAGQIKTTFERCFNSCENLEKTEFKICKLSCEIVSYTNLLSQFRRGLGFCNDKRDPEKCRDRVNNIIDDLQEKINDKKNQLTDYNRKQMEESYNIIKLFTGRIITDSKLNKDSKLQLLDYVKESNSIEVLNLLINNQITPIHEIDKQKLLNDFKTSEIKDKIKIYVKHEFIPGYEIIKSLIKAGFVAVSVIIFYTGRGIIRQIKSKLDKCYKDCKPIIKDPYRFHICRLSCEINAHKEELKELKKINCSKQDDPEECKIKVKQSIDLVNQTIKEKQNKIKNLKGDTK